MKVKRPFSKGLFLYLFYGISRLGVKCYPKEMNRSSESGIALYYIFLGVALFGALSFAVTQMNRGGGDNIKDDVYFLHAGQIVDFGRALQVAVKTLKIDGIPDSRISFENDIVGGYVNAACLTTECEVFDPAGGGVMYRAPESSWLDVTNDTEPTHGEWVFTGANEVSGVGTEGAGAASSELLAILPWVNRSVCVAINDMLEIDNPGGNPPQDNLDVDLTAYTGSYSSGDSIGGGDPEIEGRRAGCFEGDGDPAAGSYHFFQVLVAR